MPCWIQHVYFFGGKWGEHRVAGCFGSQVVKKCKKKYHTFVASGGLEGLLEVCSQRLHAAVVHLKSVSHGDFFLLLLLAVECGK